MIKKDNKVTTNLGLEIEVEPSYKHMSFPAQNIIATTIKTIVASLCDYKGVPTGKCGYTTLRKFS